MHFRSMFDTKAIGVWDLGGQDRVCTITAVKAGTVEGEKGRKDKKAFVQLREFELPFVCNVTNAKTIAGLYGADTRAWVGKRITLYPTTTKFGSEMVDCIRVRPTVPRDHGQQGQGQQQSRQGQQGQQQRRQHPIAAATSAEELLAAIAQTAGWITEAHEERWPKVLGRCAELGVSEEQAVEAVAKATRPEG